MDILKELTSKFLESKKQFIDSFDIIVIDNNLSQNSIVYLLQTYQHKTIVMDAVSTKKVLKIKDHLKYIDLLKVNQLELDELSNKANLLDQISNLQKSGATNLLITNQDKDIILATNDKLITEKPIKIDKIVNATGAGDAFLSGFIHGMIHSENNQKKLSLAKKTAYITLLSNNLTNELLSIKEVEKINE